MKPIRVMTIFGTRPEAIKMAPMVKELAARPGVSSICCVTAQHREMLDAVLEIFRLKPDYDLNIMEPRQTLSTITTKCLLGMEGVLEEAKPDLVLVHGDTSTTFAGALAAGGAESLPLKAAYAAAMAAQHTSYACVEKNIRAMVGRLHRAGGAPYARLMGGLPSERPSNDAFLRRLAGRLPEM